MDIFRQGNCFATALDDTEPSLTFPAIPARLKEGVLWNKYFDTALFVLAIAPSAFPAIDKARYRKVAMLWDINFRTGVLRSFIAAIARPAVRIIIEMPVGRHIDLFTGAFNLAVTALTAPPFADRWIDQVSMNRDIYPDAFSSVLKKSAFALPAATVLATGQVSVFWYSNLHAFIATLLISAIAAPSPTSSIYKAMCRGFDADATTVHFIKTEVTFPASSMTMRM